jgi:hypothetical protein
MSDGRFSDQFEESKKEIFYKKQVLLPSLWTSYTASACTETLKYVTNNVDVLAALTSLWESLKRCSLLAKAVWDMRAKVLLSQDIGL